MNPFVCRRILILLLLRRRRRRSRIARKWYVRPLNRQRRSQCEYFTLVRDMRRLSDNEKFFATFRMSMERFDDLARRIAPLIIPTNTHESPISVGERLSATLRILGHGDSIHMVACSYRLGRSTMNAIFKQTCEAIWKVLQPEFLPFPTKENFTECSEGFWKTWNFPHCLGAVDGKHVTLKCPPNSGSVYYNYKGPFSLLLLACVDPQYKFTMVDIGAYGSQGDPGTFSASQFGRAILTESLPVPPPLPLPGTNLVWPHFFIGDEAFQLRRNFMRPFPKAKLNDGRRIFNYRCVPTCFQ